MVNARSNLRALFIAVACMAVCIGQARFAIGLLLPDMKSDLGLTYAQAGALASLNLAAYVLGVAFIPRISRHVSSIRMAQAGLSFAALGMGILACPVPTGIVAVALFVCGLAGALGWMASAAIGAGLARPGRRGRTMGIIGAANGFGIVSSSVLALLLVGTDGSVLWRLVWMVQAAIAAISLVAALREPGAIVIRGVPDIPGRLWGLAAAYACFGVGYAWFSTYYVASIEHTSRLPSAAMWGVVGVGALFGSLPFGMWSDAWGRRQVLAVSQIIAAVASALMIIVPGTLAAALVAGLLFGAVLAGMASLVPAALADMVGVEAVVAAFASLTLVFAMAQAIAPVVGGLIVDHAPGSFRALYLCCTLLFCLASVLFSRHVTAPVGVGR